MFYSVLLRIRKKDNLIVDFKDAIIDTLLPYTNFERLSAQFAEEELELCKTCHLDCFTHPLDEKGRKFCTVLFYDVVKPKWKMEQLV
jgi:hypothetical protein